MWNPIIEQAMKKEHLITAIVFIILGVMISVLARKVSNHRTGEALNRDTISEFRTERLALMDSIDRYREEGTELNMQLSLLRSRDSSLRKSYAAIIEKYKSKKDQVLKMTSSESVDYFKCQTGGDFNTILVTPAPDSTFEIPITNIKSANEKFVALDEEFAINDNLQSQNGNLVLQVKNLSMQTVIDKNHIRAQEEITASYQKELSARTQALSEATKAAEKERLKKRFWQVSTGVLSVATIVLLIR